jgi:hypothetical protein
MQSFLSTSTVALLSGILGLSKLLDEQIYPCKEWMLARLQAGELEVQANLATNLFRLCCP